LQQQFVSLRVNEPIKATVTPEQQQIKSSSKLNRELYLSVCLSVCLSSAKEISGVRLFLLTTDQQLLVVYEDAAFSFYFVNCLKQVNNFRFYIFYELVVITLL
jgi:hypothetical protein